MPIPDTKAPTILSGPTVSAITDTTAAIAWQTNEPAKGSVLYGTSNPPTTPLAESTYKTAHSQPLTGLTANTTYYIQVTATDKTGNGPTTSSVISFTTKPTPDTVAPVIAEGPTITTITHTGAVVEWKTNEPTTGSVQYGILQTLGQTATDSTLVTSHRIELTGLTADTLYYLKVSASDAATNGPTLSPLADFRTKLTPDTKAPVIVEGPMVVDISDTGATVVWKTDEPATSGVSWNNGTAYDLVTDDATLTINHSIRLTGLTASTLYNYTVSSLDTASNGPTLSAAKTFTTLPTPDTKAPVITEGPLVVNVTHKSAVIRWRTDEPADGVIQYGTTPAFGSTESHSALTQPHNMTLTGLAADTKYYFRVGSKDSAGNGPTFSATYSFKTDDQDHGKKPTITHPPEVIHKDDDKAVIYWETDEPCDSVVEHEDSTGEKHRTSDGEKTQKHQVTITNLKANTPYNVRIASTDDKGNTIYASAGRPATFLALGESSNDGGTEVVSTVGFVSQSLPDATAPVIQATPIVSSIKHDRATITWTTDEIADTQVYFGLASNAMTITAGDIQRVTNHLLVMTNLQPSTTYYAVAYSTDPSNNGPTASAIVSFTTAAAPDTIGPAIAAGPTVSSVTSTAATISWTTDEPATTQLYYGTTSGNLTQQTAIPGLSTSHTINLNGLTAGTTYYYQVISSDSSANQTVSSEGSFTTSGGLTDTTPPTTTASPVAGAYAGSQSVTLTASEAATIYYTTDGTTPTTASTQYSTPITIASTKTLKYFAKDTAGNSETVKSSTYLITTGGVAMTYSSIPGANGYTIYRSTDGVTWTSVAVVDPSFTNYIDATKLLPNTIYTYAVTATIGAAESVKEEIKTIRTPLYNGWNIIGVPYDTTGVAVASLFSSATSAAYEWVPTGSSDPDNNGHYITVSTLTPGKGYFIKTGNSSTMLAHTGAANPANVDVVLKPGWTLISSTQPTTMTNIGTTWLIDGAPLENAITAVPPLIDGSLYWWNGITYDSWSILGVNPTIEPWKAYWILNPNTVNHTLTIK